MFIKYEVKICTWPNRYSALTWKLCIKWSDIYVIIRWIQRRPRTPKCFPRNEQVLFLKEIEPPAMQSSPGVKILKHQSSHCLIWFRNFTDERTSGYPEPSSHITPGITIHRAGIIAKFLISFRRYHNCVTCVQFQD